MQLKPAELAGALKRQLLPVYLVTGDEALLVEEACDELVAAARAVGYDEREVLHVDGAFRWPSLLESAATLSLFSSRRLIDVRNPTAKFDKEASEVLAAYAAAPPEATLLLIRCPRLEPRQRSSRWYKALDGAGAIVTVWPVSAGELPRWLERRAGAAGLRFTREALALLADRVEGNLLAAVQELQKLKLLDLPSPIAEDALAAALEDASHHDAFHLIDAALAGDGDRVVKVLANLKLAGVSLFAVLGAITAQLRRFKGGGRPAGPRARLAERFLKRTPPEELDLLLGECALIDRQGKGGLYGDAWLTLETLCLRMAGHRVAPALEDVLDYRRLAL